MPLAKARRDCSEAKLMIRPHPFFRIPGTMDLAKKKGAATLRFCVTSQSASVISSAGRRVLIPAALIKISGAPKGLAAWAATSARQERSDKSAARTAVSPGVCSDQEARVSARRAIAITCAPCAASRLAAPCPKPLDAPVTTAILHSTLNNDADLIG